MSTAVPRGVDRGPQRARGRAAKRWNRSGEVAVYVLWDESSSNGTPQPNLFVSPYIQPTVSTATMNLFAALRAAEDQLGVATHRGCASGAVPGTGAACPAGSTADVRSIFNF